MANEQIESLFKENLDNVNAYISSGGLLVQGGIEQTVYLKYHRFHGIHCYTIPKWQDVMGNERFEITMIKILNDVRIPADITYDQRDRIRDHILPSFLNLKLRVGTILPYGIKSINTNYDKESIESMSIIYDNGSIIKITNIEPVKTEIL